MGEEIQKSGPRILRYRGQVRWAAKLMMWLGVLCLVTGTHSLILSLVNKGVGVANLPSEIVPMFFGALVFLGLYYRLFRPFILARISVLKDRIVIQRGDKIEEILYSEIEVFESKVLRGWFALILKNGKRYGFTVTLERSEYVVEGIYQSRPDLIPAPDYKKLRQKLVLIDHTIARYHELYRGKNLVSTFFSLFVVPLIGAFGLHHLQSQEILIHFTVLRLICGVCLGIVLAILIQTVGMKLIDSKANAIVVQRMLVNPADKRRDVASERRLIRILRLGEIFGTLSVYVCAFIFNLNLLGQFEAHTDIPNFKVKLGDTFWVDKRYNCVDCKYSLQKGDLILTDLGNLAGVVGVPGETVETNFFDAKTFSSIGYKTKVPSGQLAVQIWNKDRAIAGLLDTSKVGGLISRSFPTTERQAPIAIPPAVIILPPQFDSSIGDNCSPSEITDISKSLQQVKAASELLFKSRDYAKILEIQNSLIQGLQSRLPTCQKVQAALVGIAQKAKELKTNEDQAWFMGATFSGILKELSRRPASQPKS